MSRFLIGLIVGTLLAGAIAIGHFTARFDRFYHELGLHSLVVHQAESQGGAEHATTQVQAGHDVHAGHGAHAGHEGMNMPGMDMGGTSMPEQKSESSVPGHAIVTISPERQQLIGVRLGKVVRDKLVMSVSAVGIVEPDQTRLVRIQSRVSGWISKLYVNFVGQKVAKNDPLLEIYSPDLVSTQNEYLLARSRQPAAEGTLSQSDLAQSSRRRLELYGVAPQEIAEIERTGKPRDTLLLRSPIAGEVLSRDVFQGSYIEPSTQLYRIADLSVVWLQAKVYEYELPHIEIGQRVDVTLLTEPHDTLQGKVSFVEPLVQEATRTTNVRVEINNSTGRLKPGMYAELRIEHQMGEGLLIPDSAVLRTGERAIAFRALPDGRFEPVAVKLGSRFGTRVQVLEGLEEGDEVVTSAGFLIDSESRLKTATTGGGHHHHGG
jgi:Cu(I)/Ag(I) efflux system membrane fusion protein